METKEHKVLRFNYTVLDKADRNIITLLTESQNL